MNEVRPPAQARVLVVDDRTENVELLEAFLQPEGYQVLQARDHEQALTIAQTEQPDLVLLDVAMPGVDGYQICRQLKHLPATAHIPVVLISAIRREVADITRGLEAGADGYVTKPVDRRELLARVRAMLRTKFMRDELEEKRQALQHANEQLRRQASEIRRLNEELRFQNAQLQVKNMLMELELDMAREVQKGLLPREIPQRPGIALAACYLPTGRVGGDLYDFASLDDDALGLFIADVAGHGLPAAFIAAMTKIIFDSYAPTTHSSAELLSRLNRQLAGNLAMGLYVTIFYGIYRLKDRVLTYTRAGHPKPILLRAGGDVADALDTEGHVVGAFEQGDFGEAQVVLEPGDTLVLFTDGINECVSPTGERYSSDHLLKFVRQHQQLGPEELIAGIRQDLSAWTAGEPFRDDVTVVVMAVQSGL
jgi:sigma-B regulation protein RsbU (phosphoserine phosphatase)